MRKKYKLLINSHTTQISYLSEKIDKLGWKIKDLKGETRDLRNRLKQYITKEDIKKEKRYIRHWIGEIETKISIKWYDHVELIDKLKTEIAKPLDNFKEELQLLRNEIEELKNE